jgi:hypothetical protein
MEEEKIHFVIKHEALKKTIREANLKLTKRIKETTLEQIKQIHQREIIKWGDMVKVCPEQVEFTLLQEEDKVVLWPNTPLQTLKVEEDSSHRISDNFKVRKYGSNMRIIERLLLGFYYYQIELNPMKLANSTKNDSKFTITIERS